MSPYRDHYRAALLALWGGDVASYRRMVGAICGCNQRRADALLRVMER